MSIYQYFKLHAYKISTCWYLSLCFQVLYNLFLFSNCSTVHNENCISGKFQQCAGQGCRLSRTLLFVLDVQLRVGIPRPLYHGLVFYHLFHCCFHTNLHPAYILVLGCQEQSKPTPKNKQNYLFNGKIKIHKSESEQNIFITCSAVL